MTQTPLSQNRSPNPDPQINGISGDDITHPQMQTLFPKPLIQQLGRPSFHIDFGKENRLHSIATHPLMLSES
jgi:hypothetical protein